MDIYQQLLQFLASIRLSTGAVEMRSALDDGSTLQVRYECGQELSSLTVDHPVDGEFLFLPTKTIWKGPGALPVEDSNANNLLALDGLRSAFVPNPEWVSSALSDVRSESTSINTAVASLRLRLRNPWTIVVIPGISGFGISAPPLQIGQSARLPRLTGFVALRNIAIDLSAASIAFELSILGAQAIAGLEPDADSALFLYFEQPDNDTTPTTAHLKLLDTVFDLKADIAVGLQVTGTSFGVQSYSARVDSASINSPSGSGILRYANDADAAIVTITGVYVGISNVTTHLRNFTSGAPQTEFSGGPIRLSFSALDYQKDQKLKLSDTVTLTPLDDQPIRARLTDVFADVHFMMAGSGAAKKVQSSVSFRICSISFDPVHFEDEGVQLYEFVGQLSIGSGFFGPSDRSVFFSIDDVTAGVANITVGKGNNDGLLPPEPDDLLQFRNTRILGEGQLSSHITRTGETESQLRFSDVGFSSADGTYLTKILNANCMLELFGTGGIQVADTGLTVTDQLTVAIDIVATPTTTPTQPVTIVAYQFDDDRGFILFRDTSGRIGLTLRQDDNGAPWITFLSTTAIPNNAMQRVWVTFNGETVRFFVNGSADGEHTHTQPIHADGASETFQIGAVASAAYNDWEGLLCDVRVWNRSCVPPFDRIGQAQGLVVRLQLRGRLFNELNSRSIVSAAGDYRFVNLPVEIRITGPARISIQDFVSRSGPAKIATTAGNAYIGIASASADQIYTIAISESFDVDETYFARLRGQGVPEEVVNLLEGKLIRTGDTSAVFDSETALREGISAAISPTQLTEFESTLLEQAPGQPMLVTDVKLGLLGFNLNGRIVEQSSSTEVQGVVEIREAIASYHAIENYPFPEGGEMVGLGPLSDDQSIVLQSIQYDTRLGEAQLGAGGLDLKFNRAVFPLGGDLKLLVPDPDADPIVALTMRLNVNTDLPGRQEAAAMISVPSALLTGIPNSADGIPLKDVKLNAYIRKFSPQLPEALRTIDHRSLINFGITIKVTEFKEVGPTEIELEDLEAVLNLIRQIIEAAGGDSPNSDISAMIDAANKILDGLSWLNKFRLLYFGILLERQTTTFSLDPDLSDSSHIGFKGRIHFQNVRPFVKYKWFHLASLKWKESRKPTSKKWWSVPLSVTVGVKVGIQFNNTKRRVEVTGVRMYVYNAALPDPWKEIQVAAQDFLYAYYGIGFVVDELFKTFQDELSIDFPESWDLSKAKLTFDKNEGTISLAIETMITDWK